MSISYYAEQAAALLKQNGIKFQRDVQVVPKLKIYASFSIFNKFICARDKLAFSDLAYCLYIEHLTDRKVIVLAGEASDNVRSFFAKYGLQVIGILDLIPMIKPKTKQNDALP